MRRWAGLAVVVAVVVIAALFVGKRPIEVGLDLDWGAAAPSLREATLVFTAADEHVARELRLSYPKGAPPREQRSVRLRPGDYTVGARLLYDGRPERDLSRPLHIEERGTYALDLE